MRVELYAAKIYAQVLRDRDNIEYNYQRFPDATRFWGMIDLVSSSNYRLVNGPGKGYVRGETFFSLVKEVISANAEIEMLKEIGDATLLAANSVRPLLESMLLIDQVASQMRLVAGDEQFPFAIRAGISYGPAKKLSRPGSANDYLGSPLDQLARILGVRESNSNLFLHDDAYGTQKQIFAEYSSFLNVSPSKMLSGKESKGMLQPIYYRELDVNRAQLLEFDQHFSPWKG